MPSRVKKLLYQLEDSVACSIDGVFTKEECDQFDREIGKEVTLYDTDGRPVVSFRVPRTIIVSKGYRWDGCSPKFNIFDLFWVGTPDGLIIGSERPRECEDRLSSLPITHERVTHLASCVHDVLGYCKYDKAMPTLFRAIEGKKDLWQTYGRRNRDRLFFELLKRKEHKLGRIYFMAVSIFGPLHDLLLGTHSKT